MELRSSAAQTRLQNHILGVEHPDPLRTVRNLAASSCCFKSIILRKTNYHPKLRHAFIDAAASFSDGYLFRAKTNVARARLPPMLIRLTPSF